MTKELATLIKLHKRKLDEMRKELVILLDARDQCLQHLKNLAEEKLAEQKAAAASDEGRYIYANYLKRAKQREERLKGILMQAEENIQKLEDMMRLEFAEMKKFEIMKERKEQQAIEEENKREIEAMDEMSTTKFIRKSQAEG